MLVLWNSSAVTKQTKTKSNNNNKLIKVGIDKKEFQISAYNIFFILLTSKRAQGAQIFIFILYILFLFLIINYITMLVRFQYH